MLERDYSHPCIIVWVPFNESWGVPNLPGKAAHRHCVQALYHLTKALDTSRPVGDVGDASLLNELMSKHAFAAVLHFAGSIVVPESVTEPLAYYDNNTVKAHRLVQACTQHGVDRLVFSSTAAVYGENVKAALGEDLPLEPANPYSRSKLMTEWMIEDTARVTPLRYVVLRYFNVAGADLQGRLGQRSKNATHLIKVACEVISGKRTSLTVFGEDYPTPDGTGIRDYIHVEDLASAHLAALRYLEGDGKSTTLNCGYGRGYSVKEVLAEVKQVAGEFAVKYGARRAGDVASLIADVGAIHRTLDWKPRYDNLNVNVSSALAWEKSLQCTNAN